MKLLKYAMKGPDICDFPKVDRNIHLFSSRCTGWLLTWKTGTIQGKTFIIEKSGKFMKYFKVREKLF